MFESVTKLFAKQPERDSHQMTAQPQANASDVVTQQPSSGEQMTADNTRVNMRGGGGGGDVCCGICAGIACFECFECCC